MCSSRATARSFSTSSCPGKIGFVWENKKARSSDRAFLFEQNAQNLYRRERLAPVACHDAREHFVHGVPVLEFFQIAQPAVDIGIRPEIAADELADADHS